MAVRSPQRSGEVALGSALGRWHLDALLGKGGMGEVYKAHELGDARRIAAVKTMQMSRTRDSDFADRFQIESALLARIRHPNVVRLYESGITPAGMAWFAMEYIEGWSLLELLEHTGRLSVPDALQILSEIADGVDAAHRVGAAHRDLKPANVMITIDHEVKVVDFGTSKILDGQSPLKGMVKSTEAAHVLGTWAYMAPERLLGEPPADYRVDTFSIGVMAYELIGGRHPFANPDGSMPSREMLGNRIILKDPEPLTSRFKDFPDDIWTVVKLAMAKAPSDRWPSVATLAERFRRARATFLASRGMPQAKLEAVAGLLPHAAAATPDAGPAIASVSELEATERAPRLVRKGGTVPLMDGPVVEDLAHAAPSAPPRPLDAPTAKLPAERGPGGFPIAPRLSASHPGVLVRARLDALPGALAHVESGAPGRYKALSTQDSAVIDGIRALAPSRRRSARRRWLVPLLALAFLAIIGLAVYLLIHRTSGGSGG